MYYYNSAEEWSIADYNSEANGTGLLGIALGTNSTTQGMLLEGIICVLPGGILGASPTAGDILYVGTI